MLKWYRIAPKMNQLVHLSGFTLYKDLLHICHDSNNNNNQSHTQQLHYRQKLWWAVSLPSDQPLRLFTQNKPDYGLQQEMQ